MSLSLAVHKFIEKEELFLDSSALLCAVSGGRDSMVMLDILRKLGYRIQVAHINYMLRGKDSIQDQALIVQYCREHNLTLHTKELTKTESKALDAGNLQEKARILRYTWFKELLSSSSSDVVCIAHHKGDVAETFLLHALRGSGINGLKSIQHTSNHIRRPLLCLHPAEIDQYASQFDIPFRHDASNFSNKYDRNYIRNETIKSLEERWPSAIDKISFAAANVSQELNLLSHLIDKEKTKWQSESSTETSIGPISELRIQAHNRVLTYHLIKAHSFNYDMVDQMLSPHSSQGAVFYSETHTACIHNDHILIRSRSKKNDESYEIEGPKQIELRNGMLLISKTNQIVKDSNPTIEYIELDESRWPLTIRDWEGGDKIKPLGMNGKTKKVSDILIDQKASFFEKENQLVLLDNAQEIIWVIGRKLSESVRYTNETKEYLKLEYKSL